MFSALWCLLEGTALKNTHQGHIWIHHQHVGRLLESKMVSIGSPNLTWAQHVTTHRFTIQEARGSRSQRSQQETQMGATSCKTPWCDGMTVWTPRGNHVWACPSVSMTDRECAWLAHWTVQCVQNRLGEEKQDVWVSNLWTEKLRELLEFG